MVTKAAALRLFTRRVDAHCNEYERVRLVKNAEHQRLLEEFRAELHIDSEDILRHASQVRLRHNLQTPTRDWETGSADPTAQQLVDVDTMCLAVHCQAQEIRKKQLNKYLLALVQNAEGLFSNNVQLEKQHDNRQVHKLRLREAELIAEIEDEYCRIIEGDHKLFEDLLCFYQEAVVGQVDDTTVPLVQTLQALQRSL